MHYVRGIVIVIAASMACSRAPQRIADAPIGPSTVVVQGAMSFATGVSGPMDVLFPSRADAFQFRNDLEIKYQTGLNRGAGATFVDREGEVVWTQEYIRYRANGCDHGTGLQRVMAQIDGNPPGGICQAPSELSVILYPSRADVLEFRRALEIKYQQMGRGLTSSFVDIEGSSIWTQEYLRYRTNACDHSTAQQKVFSQIDGGPVSATCFVPCIYTVAPGVANFSQSAASSTFEIRPNQVGCAWTLSSNASWLTFPTDYRSGTGFSLVPYTVSQNNGDARSGRITVTWATGSTTFFVEQAGTPFVASFQLVDGFRSVNTTNECFVRSTSTPCTFTANANLTGGNYLFSWTAVYDYGTRKTVTQTNRSNTFVLTEACGGTGSSVDGVVVDLEVTLTIDDDQGNTITLRSGQINQPALTMKLFTCS